MVNALEIKKIINEEMNDEISVCRYRGILQPSADSNQRDASGVLKLKLVFIVQLTHRCYFGTETGLDMSSWTTLICNSNIPSNFYSYYYHYVILSFYLFSHLLNYRLF